MKLDKMDEASWRVKQFYPECEMCKVYASCYSMNCPASEYHKQNHECPYDYNLIDELLEMLVKNNGYWNEYELGRLFV